MTTFAERRANAITFMQNESRHPGRTDWHNQCQRVCRSALHLGPGYDIPPGYTGYSSAIISWSHVDKADRHASTDAPGGVPGAFAIGQFGHRVIMDFKHGWCWSSDIKRRGCVDLVPVEFIVKHWGAKWLGWSATCNGVRIYGSAP